MTPLELQHWERLARKAHRRALRENALVLLVCLPMLVLLNGGWLVLAWVTGRWWIAIV